MTQREDQLQVDPHRAAAGTSVETSAFRRACTLLFLAFVFCHSSSASSLSSSLEGVVTEWSSGAPVSDVSVIASGEDRPVTREVTSDSSGSFRFPMLPPGRYSVTASKTGFSTVTLVGVEVHPGEIRRTTIRTAPADEDELVTETVSDTVLPFGTESLAVLPPHWFEQLPVRDRSLTELAGLLPAGTDALVAADLPVDAFSQASVVVAEFDAAGGRVAAEPRSGLDRPWFSLLLRYGDRVGTSTTESATGAPESDVGRFDGVITFAGSNQGGTISAFGLADHVDDASEYVVRSGGIDPVRDGEAFDAPARSTRLLGSLTASAGPRQTIRVIANVYDGSERFDVSPLTSPTATRTLDRQAWSAGFLHDWQVSAASVNDVGLYYSRSETETRATAGDALLFPSGYRDGAALRGETVVERETLELSDRFALLAGRDDHSHELRATTEARLGLYEKARLRSPDVQMVFLEDSMSGGVSDLTVWSGVGEASLDWNRLSLSLEDAISIGRRTRLAVGVRAAWWDGSGFDQAGSSLWKALSTQTKFDESYLALFRGEDGSASFDGFELDPRVSLAFDSRADGTTVLLASWGRYHAAPDPTAFGGAAFAANGSLGVVYHASDNDGIRSVDGSLWSPGQPLPPGEVTGFIPNEIASPDVRLIETERLALAFRKELGDLTGVTLDLVSSKVRNLPYAIRANPRLDEEGQPQESRRFPAFGDFRIWQFDGEADILQVIAGARTSLFGKVDATLTYTWSDADGNAPLHLTSPSPRPYQPDRLPAEDAIQDPLDPRCQACFGPLDGVPDHRLSFAASVRVLADWDLGLVFRFRSGLPYTRFDERLGDPDRDGFRQDLAGGAKGINDSEGPGAAQLDLRVVRHFEIGGVALSAGLDMFNVFDDRQEGGLNRFGSATSFAGDPGEPPGRSISISLRVGG